MEHAKDNSTRRTGAAGASTYMSYLLRYVRSYPVSVAELQKMATVRNFPRLVSYFATLPPTYEYSTSHEILEQFKHPGHQ